MAANAEPTTGAVLAAIVYLVQAGCSWRKRRAELFGVGRATVHLRVGQWTASRLWEPLHHAVLTRLNMISEIAWARALVDSIAVRATRGTGYRSKPGRPR
jgi:transposase